MKTTSTFKTTITDIITNSLDGERPEAANIHWALEMHEKNDCMHSIIIQVFRIDLMYETENVTLDLLEYEIDHISEHDLLRDEGFQPRELCLHGRNIQLHY